MSRVSCGVVLPWCWNVGNNGWCGALFSSCRCSVHASLLRHANYFNLRGMRRVIVLFYFIIYTIKYYFPLYFIYLYRPQLTKS
jgi:hypothetical protein